MSQFKTTRFVAPLAIALALGTSGSALAQSAQGGAEGSASASTQQNLEVSKAEIQSFAKAQAQVAEIGKKYTPKMKQAESKQAMQKTRRKAQKEMVTAVKGSGLSVQKYNKIARAAQNDKELRARIQSAQ